MAASKSGSKGTAGTGRALVIVESPSKARTIGGYLGSNYVVESSIGHIRDLPRNADEVPASYKDKPWARLGVDVDNGFEPLYIVTPDKKAQVAKLKAVLKDVDELYLATDEDREGEAIAWHLVQALSPQVPIKRMVFHEITPAAIAAAVANPREINNDLVHAQETRRILDRLYGYEVSPVLWKKVMPRLSAGRVQSVATRVIVERERARMRFNSAGYWDIVAGFDAAVAGTAVDPANPSTFDGELVAVDGARVASGRDFGEDGRLTAKASNVLHLDEAAARALAVRLEGAAFAVTSVEDKPYTRRPSPPFMTSTLQQEAGRKLRLSSQQTMRTAQRLYENGYITYMRTDSTTLSETALNAARAQARALYGDPYVPEVPRRYEKKVKNAQEAHEAIRPAGDSWRTPGELARELSGEELRLYELIWQRTVASQMTDARGQSLTVRIAGASSTGESAEFSTTGRTITFPGFMRAYVEGADDPDAELEDRERRLPRLAEGQQLRVDRLEPTGHATNPPARFTEASLIKTLEEMGVGRPSTYTSIIGTIQDRGYVFKKGTALVPSFVAFSVIGLLEQYFGRLVDYNFTASMEDDLDDIANGERESTPWLTRFYFGAPDLAADAVRDVSSAGLKSMVSERLDEIDAREVNSIPLGQDSEGREIVIRVGRYGPYLQRGDDRASIPDDTPPDEVTIARATELLEAPQGDRELGTDPQSGLPVVVKAGRYGPYVATVPPEGSKDKPQTASLFKDMSVETIELDEALRLLSLPRVVGLAEDGEQITAQNGRYGPYVTKGKESRSLASEEELFTVDLPAALALLAQPKARGRAAAAPPLRTLGNDAVSGQPMVVKEGRFGAYVTDGETNASLRKDDSVEELTDARASELLADRRARGPVKKTARRAPAKKVAAKKVGTKSVAKTAAKKTAAKKAPAKKTAA
ncbi:MAG: topoisomerase, partial [Frankiales bacterium]|nr:topoisomerase [Frankiales bacterium]